MSDEIIKRNPKLMFVCAMCDHGIDARNRSPIGEYVGCGHENCLGPSRGGAYPEYKGVLSGYFDQWCYVCGARRTGVVKVKDKFLGICEYHKTHLMTQVHRNGGRVYEKFKKDGADFRRLDNVGGDNVR